MWNVFRNNKPIRHSFFLNSFLWIFGFLCLHFLIDTSQAHAFTIKGIAYQSDGVTPLSEKVSFTFSIYDPNRQCILYQEKQININLATKGGAFSLVAGALKTTDTKRVKGVDPRLSLDQVYQSTGQVIGPTGACPGYTASPGDLRYLRIQITRTTPSETITLYPDLAIDPTTRTPTIIEPIEVTGTVSQSHLLTLVSGEDASTLHHHDSRYIKVSVLSPSDLGSGGSLYTGAKVGVGTTAPQAASLFVQTKTATTVGQVIREPSQTSANLLEFRNSSNQALSSLDSSGNFYIGAKTTENLVTTKGYVQNLLSGVTPLPTSIPESSVNWASPDVNRIPANKFACGSGQGIVQSTATGTTCSLLSQSEIPALTWEKISSGKPTTLSGYGITDSVLSSTNVSLSGIPRAPTAAVNTNTSQIATTAFVLHQASTTPPLMNGEGSPGSSLTFARADHVHPSDTTRAPASHPTLTGDVRFPGSGIWNSQGKVGVGTTSPAAALDIQGQMRTLTTSAGSPTSGALTIDWNAGNIQYTTGDCSGPTTYNFQNMLEGGIYTLAMTGTGGGTCTFTDGMNTFKFPLSGNTVTAGSQALFTFLVANSTVFVSWEEF